MKEQIKWLREVEYLAQEVYQQAASAYTDDPEFKKFLEQNAKDEAWHAHIMDRAAQFIDALPEVSSAITLDEKYCKQIEKSFSEIKISLEQNALTKDELIKKIIEAELSEWNNIFVFFVNLLQEKVKEFKTYAPRIQAHVKRIEVFAEKINNRDTTLAKLANLPPVWVENILVVDDEKMVADLVKAILKRYGKVDTACNGQEAMQLIESNYYKLIVSDVDMPVMDGFLLFREAVKKFPKLKNRFLFITGFPSVDKKAFFENHQVRYMEKPFRIDALKEEASQILLAA